MSWFSISMGTERWFFETAFFYLVKIKQKNSFQLCWYLFGKDRTIFYRNDNLVILILNKYYDFCSCLICSRLIHKSHIENIDWYSQLLSFKIGRPFQHAHFSNNYIFRFEISSLRNFSMGINPVKWKLSRTWQSKDTNSNFYDTKWFNCGPSL